MFVAEDLTGRKFGRLTVIERCKENTKQGKPRWICKCDCGNEHIVSSACLKSGKVRSCGCLSKDTIRTYKHGMTHTKLHSVWHNMKDRCYREKHPSYQRYGGRGIYVCDKWKDDFISFYEWAIENGYEEGLSLDRIDNDGPYSPKNCRWVTMEQQANNRCANHMVTYRGETKTLTEWSKVFNCSYAMILRRLESGWSVDRALETRNLRPRNKMITKTP